MYINKPQMATHISRELVPIFAGEGASMLWDLLCLLRPACVLLFIFLDMDLSDLEKTPMGV